MEFKIIYFEELASTNDYIKKHYEQFDEGTVIVTNHQTKGYGRMGRGWFSEAGQNLTFSLLLYPRFDKTKLSELTPLTCVSVFEVIKKIVPKTIIKWPNDLLVEKKKLSGILTEAIYCGNDLRAVIIGIGINVRSKSFPSELKDKTTSLALETNIEFNLEQLLSQLLENFQSWYERYLQGERTFIDIFKNNFPYIGKTVLMIDHTSKKVLVKIIDFLPNGNLLVQENNKILEFSSGEISLNINNF